MNLYCWRRLAAALRAHARFVAHRLGDDPAALAARLGVNEQAVLRLLVCRSPRTAHMEGDLAGIADRTRIPATRLRQLLLL